MGKDERVEQSAKYAYEQSQAETSPAPITSRQFATGGLVVACIPLALLGLVVIFFNNRLGWFFTALVSLVFLFFAFIFCILGLFGKGKYIAAIGLLFVIIESISALMYIFIEGL